MERNRLLFLCSCLFLWYKHADSHTEQGSYWTASSQIQSGEARSEDDWTNVVLLRDTVERFRRQVDVNGSNVDQKSTDAPLVAADVVEDNNVSGVSTTQSAPSSASESNDDGGGSRGYFSNQELVNTVDQNEQKFNKTVKEKHFSYETNETQKYYKSEFKTNGGKYFIDLDVHNFTGDHRGKVLEHNMLSKSYRRAATISLSFRFPFYGHEVENITIATGGFLYTGDYVHSWLAATQYIAPLMANFDTSKNDKAKIRYLDTGDYLVVEWKDVYLQDREKEGEFTFQVVLHKTGDIDFAYKNIPLSIITIQDEDHPVKVGLSDAYIIDRTIFFVRRKTIYEYHRVNKKTENITSMTAIVFKSLPTCNRQTSCETCLNRKVASPQPDLKCQWCEKQHRCSDGMDRNRQDWLTANCDQLSVLHVEQCGQPGQVIEPRSNSNPADDQYISDGTVSEPHQAGQPVSPGGVVTLVITCLLIVALIGWLGYAYFYPHTWSGQILIKYRPSAWRWRQSGARYTAASIHM